MNKKLLILVGFVLMVLFQLYAPAKMIWDRENVIKKGTEFHFLTRPVDPNDPFRGKYITLSYAPQHFPVSDFEEWSYRQKAYVTFDNDENGFAQIIGISKTAPTNTKNYARMEVRKRSNKDNQSLTVYPPFTRFYMEESKAYPAEKAYNKSARDSSSQTYAVVSIYEGVYVLKDVFIDGVPIGDVLREQ